MDQIIASRLDGLDGFGRLSDYVKDISKFQHRYAFHM